jgi:threonine dehydratase
VNLVTLDEIRAAAKRLTDVALRTPVLPASWAAPGASLLLKAESLQPIGAFKIRGAYNKIAALPAEVRERGVVAYSSGNHAQAVAYAAKAFGIPASIVIQHGVAEVKVTATRSHGAEVIRVDPADRVTAAVELAERQGRVLVAPFDDRDVIAGQGTIGLELAEDVDEIDRVLVPISGGGLISGVAVAIKALSPRTQVVGVEPALAADAAESFRRGERIAWTSEAAGRTIADGLRTPEVGALPWAHIRELVDDVVTVEEDEIRDAIKVLALGSRLVAEPSGAVPVAAYRSGRLPAVGRTVAVVSGGNIDPALLVDVLSGTG